MSLRALRLLSSLAVLTSLSLASCNFSVKSTGSETDSDAGTSGTTGQACGGPQTNTDDACECLPGFDRCDPESGAIECCPQCPDPHSEPLGGDCFCEFGWAWCDDQPDACCPVEGPTTEPPTTSDSTTGTSTVSGTTTEALETTGTTTDPSTTTGGEQCPGAQPPPDSCNPGQESFWCTQPEACGPEGGEVFRCVGEQWVPDQGLAQQNCTFDGYDFAYGCVDDGNKVEFVCGDGPGTPCDGGDAASCVGEQALQQCVYGKLTEYDCLVQCTEIGDERGVLYDHGSCGEQDGRTACLCCDEGDPGCPI